MAWTLAQAKIYLGSDDPDTPAGDLVIQQVLDETLASLENLLGRKLLLNRETVRFLHVSGTKLLLPRFPIKQIHSISGGATLPGTGWPTDLDVQYSVGWIGSGTFPGQRSIEVDYEGGYEALPMDLERDMWSAFLTLYNDTDPLTAAPPKAGEATVVAGTGDVSSITVADFGTVKYDVGATVAAADSAASGSADWGWLATWYPTFQRYRAGTSGVGLGVV